MKSKGVQRECIVSVATPPGRGGIGVIRLSGEGARRIAWRVFRPLKSDLHWEELPSHRALFGTLVDPQDGAFLDEGLFLYLREGQSYTGEETVELQGHGSPLLLETLLQHLLAGGARLAEAGEFTKRAFLNGRLDLTMAEGVRDLIEARSALALRQAQKKLRGELSSLIEKLRRELLELRAEVEAQLDFPEESIPLPEAEQLCERLRAVRHRLLQLQESYRTGQLIKEGFHVVLAGPPNVGKSSLFNALLGRDRAIVSPHPGTTRDYLEAEVEWENIPIILIDIAGISKKTVDFVEKVGIEKGNEQIEKADLILFVDDLSNVYNQENIDISEFDQKENIIKVGNKSDLIDKVKLQEFEKKFHYFVSAKENIGINKLKSAVIDIFNTSHNNGAGNDKLGENNYILLTSLWQKQKISNTIKALDKSIELIKQWDGVQEIIAAELADGCNSLGDILGADKNTEELLDVVFSKFCIGK